MENALICCLSKTNISSDTMVCAKSSLYSKKSKEPSIGDGVNNMLTLGKTMQH